MRLLFFYFSYTPLCNGNVNAQELYSKLVTLHLHQQAQEMLTRESLLATGSSDMATHSPHPLAAPLANQSPSLPTDTPPMPAQAQNEVSLPPSPLCISTYTFPSRVDDALVLILLPLLLVQDSL